jgi:predicted metal-dependent phosphoesterase TrpH
LHTHSAASDGSLRPAELVRLADQVGLTALALTDHDTVDGIPEAMAEADGARARFVPGVELSARLEGGTLHLVGLFIDHEHPGLREGLDRVRAMRRERNPRIAEALERIGLPVSLDEAAEVAGGDIVSRVHFAQVMTRKGYVRDTDEAFARFLAKGGPADIPKRRLEPGECIRLIRAAGGVAVLAHPNQTRRQGAELRRLVDDLAGAGLSGMEVRCSGLPPSTAAWLSRLAAELGLLPSGGSDFHGRAKPGIRLGRGPGRLHVPDSFLGPLERAAEEIRRGAHTATRKENPP